MVSSNHHICPVYSAQQSLHLIQHHSSTHLLIPIHQKMCGNVHSASNSINNQLLIIHPFIYSSPFIQDPVSLKHPEAKHSSAHQGRINVRQCAHFRHILSNILSILKPLWNQSHSWKKTNISIHLDTSASWRWLKASENCHGIYADTFPKYLRHLVNVWEMFNLS